MKNIGQYNQDLSVPRKIDIDSLETRVKTNEDNIAMAESDIEGLTTDVGALKTDVNGVKAALTSKQDTIVGAASTIVENNLTAGKVLVSNASGKVDVASVGINDINPDGKYLKLSGGMVNGPVYLFGGVAGPLTVKSGSVTLNERYSIGYGDGNYNFIQINGNFQLIKGWSTQQGVYIASSTDGTDGSLTINVNNDSQTATTHMSITSNGVVSLSAEASSSGSYTVNNVRITGVADGTEDSDAVNLKQIQQLLTMKPGTLTLKITSSSSKEKIAGVLYENRLSGTGTMVDSEDNVVTEYNSFYVPLINALQLAPPIIIYSPNISSTIGLRWLASSSQDFGKTLSLSCYYF
nr:MAG TPA: hypothetical protein [Caudoviricetes sp.]